VLEERKESTKALRPLALEGGEKKKKRSRRKYIYELAMACKRSGRGKEAFFQLRFLRGEKKKRERENTRFVVVVTLAKDLRKKEWEEARPHFSSRKEGGRAISTGGTSVGGGRGEGGKLSEPATSLYLTELEERGDADL